MLKYQEQHAVHMDISQRSPQLTEMEWWLKAGLTIIGVSSAFTANHLWKEHYKKLGLEHPITTYLRSITTNEEEDRRKRIEEIAIQSALSEARLSKITKFIPKKFRESGSISNQQPVSDEAWKSDFS